MKFEKYPFEKLRELLVNAKPNSNKKSIDLTIGEPQFETPLIIQNRLKESTGLLKKYPKSAGEEAVRESMINFVSRRFGVKLDSSELIPTFGTREVLFNFPQYYLFNKKSPKIAFTNPFYQIYEGSAIASRAEIYHINLEPENYFKPKIVENELSNVDLVIINFPNNPTASNLTRDEFKYLIKLSQKYNFVLINDECYSEIYIDTKPLSILEVAQEMGISDFKNILAINSISKRSSAPGLRSGFIAGDREILRGYGQYRTYLGTAIPLPLQMASIEAWNDDFYAENIRAVYKKNLELASNILNIQTDFTFYLWLPVKNDLEITIKLYIEENLKVLPGRYLGRNGAGENYIRVALVESSDKVLEALNILKKYKEIGEIL